MSTEKKEAPTNVTSSADESEESEQESEKEVDPVDPILVKLEPIVSLDSGSEAESGKEDNGEQASASTKPARPYTCEQCGRSYKLSGYLKRHMLTCNPHEERKFICTYCGMIFDRGAALYHHNFKHKNDKKHSCTECKKTFNRKNTLDRHMLVHSGEKPYNCDLCAKRFTQKQNLTMHIKVHNGERDHKCLVCQKTFMTRSKLRLHSKRHFKLVKPEPDSLSTITPYSDSMSG